MLVVLADVTHELSLQVRHRGEHAARDHVTFNLRESKLDSVQRRAARLAPETAATPDPWDQAPESPSSCPRRTPPHAAVD